MKTINQTDTLPNDLSINNEGEEDRENNNDDLGSLTKLDQKEEEKHAKKTAFRVGATGAVLDVTINSLEQIPAIASGIQSEASKYTVIAGVTKGLALTGLSGPALAIMGPALGIITAGAISFGILSGGAYGLSKVGKANFARMEAKLEDKDKTIEELKKEILDLKKAQSNTDKSNTTSIIAPFYQAQSVVKMQAKAEADAIINTNNTGAGVKVAL